MQNNNQTKFYEKFIDKEHVSKFSKEERKPYRVSYALMIIFSTLLVLSSLMFGYKWENGLIGFVICDIVYALFVLVGFIKLLFAQRKTHLFKKTSSIFLLFLPCFIVWIGFSVLGAIFTKYDLATKQFENNYSIYFILAFIPIDILVTRLPGRGMSYPLKNIVIGEETSFEVKEDSSESSVTKKETIVDVKETIKEQTEITKTSDINLDNYYAITSVRKRRVIATSFANYACLTLLYTITTLFFGIYFTNELGIAAFSIEMVFLAIALFYAIKHLVFVYKYKIFSSKVLPCTYVFLFLLIIVGSTLLGVFQDPLVVLTDLNNPANSNGMMALYALLFIVVWFIFLGIVAFRWLGFVNNTSTLKMMDEQESRKLLHNVFMNDSNVAKIEDVRVIATYTLCLTVLDSLGIVGGFNLFVLRSVESNGTLISCIVTASIMVALEALVMIPLIKNEIKYKSFKNPLFLVLFILLPYIGAGLSVIVDLLVAPMNIFSIIAFVVLQLGFLIFEYYAVFRCYVKYQKATKNKYKVSYKDDRIYIENRDK